MWTRFAALLAVAVAVLLAGDTARAADPAPPVSINEAQAYRNIAETDADGDFFVLLRFELPLSDWCDELTNTSGCGTTPPDPDDPNSLPQGAAFISLYDDEGDTLVTQQRVPRVGNGLGGLYLEPGHGLTWADPDLRACVESSDTLYEPPSSDCISLTFAGGTDVSAARETLESNLVQMMRNLEAALLLGQGTLVNSAGRITTRGRTFTVEAQQGLDRIVPGAFQAGSSPYVTEDYIDPTGELPLQQRLDNQAAGNVPGAGITGQIDAVALSYFGMTGQTLATVMVAIIAVLAAAAMGTATGKALYAGITFVSVLSLGMFIRGPEVAVMFVLLAVLAIAAAWWLTKRTVA